MIQYHYMSGISRVTVRSLAEELGVSPMTVSRALRRHASVRPALGTKIRRLASSRGYHVDPVVSEVMGGLGRSKGVRYRETVAFVWTHERSQASAEERGVLWMAEALGYRVDIVKPWLQGLAEKDVSRILWSRGIRGVLLAPNQSRPDPRYELDWPKFATVLVGSSLVNEGLTRLARDYFHDAKLAMTKLREAGCERVGLVLDASTHERTDRRYAAAFELHGDNAKGRLFLVNPALAGSIEKLRFEGWVARTNPGALLTDLPRSWVPAGILRVALTLGPTEAGPGVRPDFVRVGSEAMRMLDGLLRGGCLGLQSEPVSLLVPGKWVPGRL